MLESNPAVAVDHRANIYEQAARTQASRLRTAYEHHEFQVGAGVTDPTAINSVVNHAVNCSCGRAGGAFVVLERAAKVFIRNVGIGAIKVRWNFVTSDYFTIDGGEYLNWDMTEVNDIFIENDSGSAVDIRIALG